MKIRKMWTRGLTASDRGKAVEFKSNGLEEVRGILRNAEHLGHSSVITMLITVDIPHDVEVEVTD